MGKTICITIGIFLVFVFGVLGTSNTIYPAIGYNDGFVLGSGIINSANPSFVPSFTGSRTLNVANNSALVGELDGDNENEIVIQDANTIRIYRSNTLNIVSSYTLPTNYTYGQAQLYDINGNSHKEILVPGISSAYPAVLVLSEAGGTLHLNKTITLGISGACAGIAFSKVQLVCDNGASGCVAGLSQYVVGSPHDHAAVIYDFFNETHVINGSSLDFTCNDVGALACPNKLGEGQYADYDASGNPSFIYSWLNFTHETGGHESIIIDFIKINSTGNPYRSLRITKDIGDAVKSFNCTNTLWTSDSSASPGAGSVFTNPVTYDFIGGSSGGAMQTAIGYMTDKGQANIALFNTDGTEYKLFPSQIGAKFDGDLLGNIFRTNIFTEGKLGLTSKETDFCMQSYSNADKKVYFPCGSVIGFDYTDSIHLSSSSSIQFYQSVSNLSNFSTSPNFLNTISNSVDMSSLITGTEGNNLDEISSSYGISQSAITEASCSSGGIGVTAKCPLTLIYSNPKTNAVFIPVDVEKAGKDDVLMSQNNVLWYLNDGYAVQPPSITDISTNPCFDSVWNLSTLVLVTATLNDPEGFNVGADAILYYGTPYAQDSGWTANYTSGTTISFNFVANVSISSGTLRIYGRNTNTATTSHYDLPFNVGTNGQVFGESSCSRNINATTLTNASNINASVVFTNPNDNPIKNFLTTLKTWTNLGIDIMYVILAMALPAMAVIILMVRRKMERIDAPLIGLFIFEGIVAWIGFKIQIFEGGTMVIFVIVGIGAILLWFKNRNVSSTTLTGR